jgi:hypothetical protein
MFLVSKVRPVRGADLTTIYEPAVNINQYTLCEMLRILHCLDNRLIDGGEVVSPTHRPHFTFQKHYFC